MTIKLIPKLLNIKCNLTVVHDHLLGWDRMTGLHLNNSEDMKCFPYGLDITEEQIIQDSMSHADTQPLAQEQAPGTTAGAFGGPYGMDDANTALGRSQLSKYGYPGSVNALFSSGASIESAYANAHQNAITIINIPTNTRLHFKAFLTSLSDNFAVGWDTEKVYGRMDPVKIFQGTQRTISMSWDLIASNPQEGIENLKKCTNFVRMLYPTHTMHGSATSIKSPPMMAVHFTNLVSQGKYESAGPTNRGLTGTLNGFNFSPNLDAGFFEIDSAKLSGNSGGSE